jgi:RHS repeat-associated protein
MHLRTTTTVNGLQQGEPYQLHFYYDAASRPIMVRVGNEEAQSAYYSYVHSLQSDILGIIDRQQELLVQYAYDPWGKPLETRILETECETLARLNPFRYRGYQFDEETVLYYLRSRYYNPEWGRFINGDDMVGKMGTLFSNNIFAYCYNAPILLIDRSGRSPNLNNWIARCYPQEAARLKREANERAQSARVAALGAYGKWYMEQKRQKALLLKAKSLVDSENGGVIKLKSGMSIEYYKGDYWRKENGKGNDLPSEALEVFLWAFGKAVQKYTENKYLKFLGPYGVKVSEAFMIISAGEAIQKWDINRMIDAPDGIGWYTVLRSGIHAPMPGPWTEENFYPEKWDGELESVELFK